MSEYDEEEEMEESGTNLGVRPNNIDSSINMRLYIGVILLNKGI